MPNLGLGSYLSNVKSGGLITPGIVTDNLVLKHNYAAGSVIPVSDGALDVTTGGTPYVNTNATFEDTLNGNFTVVAWVWLTDGRAAGLQTLCGSRNTSQEDWLYLGFAHGGNTGAMAFYFVANGDSQSAYSDVVIPDGVTGWHHFAWAVKVSTNAPGEGLRYFYDGASAGIDGTTGVAADDWGNFASTANMAIGAYNVQDAGISNKMNGYVANWGIFNEQLDQTRIKSLMNKNYEGLTSSDKQNLVSWYNFDIDVNDSHGENNGSLV